MNQESKLTTPKLLKIGLYVTGALLLIISGFMLFSTRLVPVDNEFQFESIPLNGFQSVLWYVYILLAIVLTLIAFNIESVGMKAVFYVTLVIGGLLTVYIAFISSFKWGGPVHPSLKQGAFIGFMGLLIIVITNILFIPRSFYTRIMNVKQSLFAFGIYALLLSCAFLPYERSEYGIKNGIDHDDFFIYWIFGLLLLVLGFRNTLMSKILTFTIVGLSVLIYFNLHSNDYLYQNKSYAIGAYIAMTAYLFLETFAIYMLFRKKK